MDELYVYEYVTMYECVFDIWILILCVVRHCVWQYFVCDDEFDTSDNIMFYCFVTHGGKQNWQHNFVLYRLISVGYGHYRRKLGPILCKLNLMSMEVMAG
jgi:hypothetical protein